MDYDKIVDDNGFYLYKDDSFNTIFLQIAFQREKGNFQDAAFDLLCKYLMKTNKNYNTEYEINKKSVDLYSIVYAFSAVNIGSQTLMFFSADLVSPTIVHDEYSEDAFKFLREILLEPDFTKEKVFENLKEIYLTQLINGLSNPSIVAKNLFLRTAFAFDNEKFRYSIDEEYIRNMINSITLKDLEELYYKTIREENCDRGVVFGNITDEEFKILRENLPFKNTHGHLDYCVNNSNLKDDDLEVGSETTSESTIFVTYSMDEIDPGILKIIDDIFNGSSNLCFEILREKYGLVYASAVTISFTGKYLLVSAKIDKNNKDKFIEAVDEMIEMIKDKDSLKVFLKNAKESIKNEYNLLSEDRDEMISKIDDYVSYVFKGFDDTKFVEEIDKVKVDDILKYTKTLKRKNIFMYRGDLNE